MPTTRADRASLLASLILSALALALSWRWLAVQDIPSGGRDEFFILEMATDLAFRLGHAPWSELRGYVLGTYYPPLGRLPGVVALALGSGYAGVVASQWIWVPVAVLGTWSSARRLSGPAGALAAVALLLGGAGFVDGLHHFETNLGHVGAAAGAMAFWLASDHLRRRGPALGFGAMVGLGLMTDRLGVLPLATVPLLTSLWIGRSWRNAALAAGVAAVICGWWYVDFAPRFLGEIVPQLLSGEVSAAGELLERRPPFPFSWLHYLILWVDSQLGLVGGTVALLGLAWGIVRRREGDVGKLVLWLGGGLLLFTLVPKQQTFYTLPLLPAACAMGGVALERGLRRFGRAGLAVAALILAASWVPTVLNSGPEPPDLDDGALAWALLGRSPIPESILGQRYPLAPPPRHHGLDLDDLPRWLADRGIGPDDLVLALAVDTQVTESYLVSLARIARGSAAVVGFTLHPDAVLERAPEARALLYVHRGGPDFPGAAQVREAHDLYFGWQPKYEPLLAVPERLQRRATGGILEPMSEGEALNLWILPPG